MASANTSATPMTAPVGNTFCLGFFSAASGVVDDAVLAFGRDALVLGAVDPAAVVPAGCDPAAVGVGGAAGAEGVVVGAAGAFPVDVGGFASAVVGVVVGFAGAVTDTAHSVFG